MKKLLFIKDHPSKRFKKEDIIDMPNENLTTWLDSGYVELLEDSEEDLGNVESSQKSGESSNQKSKGQSKFGKRKKKR